jgi:hypothetical protein
MGPLSQSDGHDPPGLIGKLVPSFAAMVDEIIVDPERVAYLPKRQAHCLDVRRVDVIFCKRHVAPPDAYAAFGAGAHR